MKLIFYTLCQCIVFVAVCQDIEVLSTSGFKHDYHVIDLQYIEDLNDTSQTQFISEIRMSGSHENLLIKTWFNALKMKAKESGANMYIIENEIEDEIHETLIIKLYFAGVNFMKENQKKVDKNKIYIFNEWRSKTGTAQFYLNQKKIIFSAEAMYIIAAKPYQLYSIALTKKRSQKHSKSFPKDAASAFYILPVEKAGLITNGAINTKGTLNFIKNKPIELDYSLGRFLLAVYR